jgi:hypothetical protein
VRGAGWQRWDCHTPYPVHGLDAAMGVRESFIPFLTVSAGLFGVLFAKAMQWYMSDYDYPLMIGGKPLFSLPAFVPITFELFVLFGALTTFACILIFCRLGKWHSPLHDAGVMRDVTCNRFAIYLDATDSHFDKTETRRFLEEIGCEDIRTAECPDEVPVDGGKGSETA